MHHSVIIATVCLIASPFVTADLGPVPKCPSVVNTITYYPVTNDCTKFWECYNGNRYLFSCFSGLYWNPRLNVCDYSGNVDCNAYKGPCANEPDSTYLVDGDDCSHYYQCSGGQAVPGECATGLQFNEALATCDFPERVQCQKI